MTQLFDEVQFPTEISFRSTGGPMRQTQIVVLGSGFEARNARWLNSRRVYDAGYGVHGLGDLYTVLEFFEARNGRLIGFRWKDWDDWLSGVPNDAGTYTPFDQTIGEVGGSPRTLQLIKVYTSGPRSWTRTITKPVAGTVRIAIAGVEVHDFSVDTTTGIVTFAGGEPDGVVTAGFQFDTPVRFDTDKLEINMSQFNAGNVQSIPIIEVLI